MKRSYLFLGLLFGTVLLTGCNPSGREDFGDKYIQGQSLASLKMPPGITQSDIDPYYSVPPSDMTFTKPISILPPGSLAAKLADQKEAASTNTAASSDKKS